MIIELNKCDYIKIKKLLIGNEVNLEVLSVVEGYNPGWIFVDDINQPGTALIWSKGIEGFYFVGNPNNKHFNAEINSFIDNQLKNRMIKEGLSSFEFSGVGQAWVDSFYNIFENRQLDVSTQHVYKNTHTKITTSTTEVYKIDNDFLSREDIDIEFAINNIYSWWEDKTHYLEHGIGYAVIRDNKVVCTCITSFRNGDTMESHIETHPDYRKKGLATIAVSAFINDAVKQGYSLYWDCMETNDGSRALASKFDYKLVWQYKLFEFPL